MFWEKVILMQEQQNRRGPDEYPVFMTRKCRRQVWWDQSMSCDWEVKRAKAAAKHTHQ